MTASEGIGLEQMADGLMNRYNAAGVEPPVLLYVDRDCCALGGGVSSTKKMFAGWRDLVIRLDVWHFMRRIAIGATTEAHPLYGLFMSRLADCIFEWDKNDVDRLVAAKKSELEMQGFPEASDEDARERISSRELRLHCRRSTRGPNETIKLISHLVTELSGPNGQDTLGVPVLDPSRIFKVWDTQQRHVKCLQDPPAIQLYTTTGHLTKGSVQLPTLRCARGSTSLESFHLHVARFVPGRL